MWQRLRGILGTEKAAPDWDELWIERQTYEGGWVRQYPNTAFDRLPEQPEHDDNMWILEEGRYRAITRVDNHYGDILWEYETADADDYYAERRTEARRDEQREELETMSLAEIEAELEGDTTRLDLLPQHKIREQYQKRVNDQQGATTSEQTDHDPITQQKARLAEEALNSEAFTEEYGEAITLSLLVDSETSDPTACSTASESGVSTDIIENTDKFEEVAERTGQGLGAAQGGVTGAAGTIQDGSTPQPERDGEE